MSVVSPPCSTSMRSAAGWNARMTTRPSSTCGPRKPKGSGWRAAASASNAARFAGACTVRLCHPVASGIGEHGIHVRGDEARQIVQRSVQGEHLAEPRPPDRKIPAVAGLGPKQAELPFLETRPPATDRRFDRLVQLGASGRVEQLRTHNAHRHLHNLGSAVGRTQARPSANAECQMPKAKGQRPKAKLPPQTADNQSWRYQWRNGWMIDRSMRSFARRGPITSGCRV